MEKVELFEFKFYKSYIDTFDNLTDEQAGKLIKKMYKFYFKGDDEKTDGVTEAIFSQIKYIMEKSIKGKVTGGIRKDIPTTYPTTTPTTIPHTTPTTKDKDKDKDKVKDNNILSKDNTEQSSEIVKVDKRDLTIDIIIETMKELNLGIVDDTVKKQRQYGKLIKDKMNKIKGFDGRYQEFIIMLYNNSDEYRKNHFRSLEKFYREMANVIAGIKIKAEKPQRRGC